MIRLGKVEGKGRGVFATRRIASGAVIERAPVIVLTPTEWHDVGNTSLYNYCFRWGDDDDHAVLALGFGSLYNHSYSPNAEYLRDEEDGFIEFVALQPIAKDEEITVNYNGTGDNKPVWFDVK